MFYKLGHAIDYETIKFDGPSISLADLKTLIVEKLGMKAADFDLAVMNNQTEKPYTLNSDRVPKGTMLTIKRVRVDHGRGFVPPNQIAVAAQPTASLEDLEPINSTTSEADALQRVISAGHNFPSEVMPRLGKGKGKGRGSGPPPPHFVCRKCGKTGHWTDDCAMTGEAESKSLGFLFGVPMSHLRRAQSDKAGTLWDGSSAVVQTQTDRLRDVIRPVVGRRVADVDVPVHLQCNLCKALISNALMLKCCRNSFCTDCLQKYVEDKSYHCPACNRDLSDDYQSYLIPDKSLRVAADDFLRGRLKLKTEVEAAAAAAKTEAAPQAPAEPKAELNEVEIKAEEQSMAHDTAIQANGESAPAQPSDERHGAPEHGAKDSPKRVCLKGEDIRGLRSDHHKPFHSFHSQCHVPFPSPILLRVLNGNYAPVLVQSV